MPEFLHPARASADTETIADYQKASAGTRAAYAGRLADILREHHPGLSGGAMKACLDDVAGYDNNQALLLRATAVMCANR